MSVGPTFRAVRGGIARRRLQTVVVALVVLVSTAATVLALALVVDSSEPFDHAFSAQRGADIVAAVDRAVSAPRLAGTARLSGVTAAAGPFPEVTVAGRSAGQELPPQTLVGRSSQGGPVDDLVLSEGRWATAAGRSLSRPGAATTSVSRSARGSPSDRAHTTRR
jgi:putative ABC transport system permease protein